MLKCLKTGEAAEDVMVKKAEKDAMVDAAVTVMTEKRPQEIEETEDAQKENRNQDVLILVILPVQGHVVLEGNPSD